MSGSAFAARFSELVGEPVMQYVTRWRRYVAMDILKEQGTNVAEVANHMNYQSEAAFSRALKRVTSISPGAIRRNGLAAMRCNCVPSGSELHRQKLECDS
jgi:AraC-like DNA-binding protein